MTLSSNPPTPPADDRSNASWLGLTTHVLPIAQAYDWALRPDCGAVVLFSGTARDHSEGRPDVSVLEYEAYDEQVVPRFEALAASARATWPELRRLVMIHRVGPVPVGESAVVVVAASPHRDVAFEAGRFCIDHLKMTVPIWKREVWSEGESWGLEPQHITEVSS